VNAYVVLIPQYGLGVLPLHAAWREVDGAPRTFLDDFTVAYAPSCSALATCRAQAAGRRPGPPSLLAVIDPMSDLPFAQEEGAAVAALFAQRGQLLCGTMATADEVLQAVVGRDYVHFGCHGDYNPQDPADSSLLLAGGTRLRLADLSARLELGAARLVTLAACETGLTDLRFAPDESIGLPAGFLQAGAAAVLSTLWEVADVSAALLMRETYRLHLVEGLGPAAALRRAQIWVRSATAEELGLPALYDRRYQRSGQTDTDAARAALAYRRRPQVVPFAHPYHWAAFTLTGWGGHSTPLKSRQSVEARHCTQPTTINQIQRPAGSLSTRWRGRVWVGQLFKAPERSRRSVRVDPHGGGYQLGPAGLEPQCLPTSPCFSKLIDRVAPGVCHAYDSPTAARPARTAR
jgi:CHAT domain-containing protein